MKDDRKIGRYSNEKNHQVRKAYVIRFVSRKKKKHCITRTILSEEIPRGYIW